MFDEEVKTYTKAEVVAATIAYFQREQDLSAEDAELPAKMWADKYALRKGATFFEPTPDDMFIRLAKEFHRIELKYPNPLPYEVILEALRGFKQVVPQGSPQYGIGNDLQLTSLSNCAVVANPKDTMSGIIDTGREIANLYKRRFGAGLSLARLRPDGSLVNNAAGTSTGAHSFMDFYSYITRMVGQSGRRGALMLTIPVNHPDVEKFITKKSDLSLVTGANVSVQVTDDFMQAVLDGKPYELKWTDGTRVVTREVKAAEIFRLIAEQASKTAEPGVLFWDRIQQNLPLDFYRAQGFETISTNPCLTGDTKVAVADGRGFVAIADLAAAGKDVPVYAADKDGNLVVKTMRNPRVTGRDVQILEVELEGGHTFRATPNHKMLTSAGEYVELKDLQVGDSLHVGYKRIAKLKEMFPSANSNSQDYIWVRNQNRKNYQLEHRVVYESAFGAIPKGNVIHHIDYNAQNNSLDNLEMMSKEAHDELHAKDMLGDKNPYHRMSEEWRAKFHASTDPRGEGNGNHSGLNHEEVTQLGVAFAKALGRRFSKKEWQAYAATVGAPVEFSSYRRGALGTVLEFSLRCAQVAGVDEMAECDPRVVRTYHDMLDQGYTARIQDGRVEVLKRDEYDGEEFWTDHRQREVSFRSVQNALAYRNANPEFQARRTSATRETYAERKLQTEKDQLLVFTELRMKLGRDPKMKEWESACKERGVSSRLGSRLSSWETYTEFKHDAAEFNHRIVAIRDAGRADVYNGTVDEVHNFYFGGWDELDAEGRPKSVMVNSLQCGELPLCAYDSCRLITLYLAGFVDNMFRLKGADFNWARFRNAVRIAMRLSDDLVDLEIEKLEQIRAIADTADEREMFDKFIEKAKLGRRTGLGTHGLGDMLARLRLRYDTTEAIGFADNLYRTLKLAAYRESVELAKERGAFPMWDPKVEAECAFLQRIAAEDPELARDMTKYGRRNGAILTNAPTGSVSIESENCSSGIEPVFMFSYQRNRKVDASREDVTGLYRDAQGDYWRPYRVVHPNLQRFVKLAMLQPELYGFGPDEFRGLSYETAFDKVMLRLPDFFVTAGEIGWFERVKMQGTIQQHIDHSISSCLTGDSLIQTDAGLLTLEEMAGHAEVKQFATPRISTASRNRDGESAEISEVYNNGQADTLTFRMPGGNEITCTPNHRLLVLNEAYEKEWKFARDIVPGDCIVGRLGLGMFGDNPWLATMVGQPFAYERCTNAKQVERPTRMSPKLGLFLGMMSSDGSVNQNGIALSQEDNDVVPVFRDLVKELFGLESTVTPDKRASNLVQVQAASREISAFCTWLGLTSHDTHEVPVVIRKAGRRAVAAYLRGLTLDGCVSATGVTVISTVSFKFARQVQALLQNFGIDAGIYDAQKEGVRVFPSGREYATKQAWVVQALGTEAAKFVDLIGFLEERKQRRAEELFARSSRIPRSGMVPDFGLREKFRREILPRIKSTKLYDMLHSLTCADKQERAISRDNLLVLYDMGLEVPEFVLDPTYVFRPVTSVEEGPFTQTYDLSVPNKNSYIANGVVSHNTLNLPSGTTWEEVEHIYIEAWKQGCKGVTVYVDGSRDAQVLSAAPPKEAEAPPEETSSPEAPPACDGACADCHCKKAPVAQATHRGIKTTGDMTKATFRTQDGEERKVYAYVGLNEQGQPVETFVIDAGGNQDFIPYGAALGKLTSLALKFGIPVADITKAIGGLQGGAVSFSGKVYTSVPDLLAKLLEKAAGGAQQLNLWAPPATSGSFQQQAVTIAALMPPVTSTTIVAPASKCPSCGNLSVRKVDGCPMCNSCGWSKC